VTCLSCGDIRGLVRRIFEGSVVFSRFVPFLYPKEIYLTTEDSSSAGDVRSEYFEGFYAVFTDSLHTIPVFELYAEMRRGC